MPGYADTKKLIEDTLVNRPAGAVIMPEDHENFALSMLDYIHAVELLGASSLQGTATVDTVPVQPIGSRVSYISSVPPGQTYVYTNFLDENGQAISVTSGANTVSLLTLLWNGSYWTVSSTPVTLAVDYTNGYLFKGVAVPSTNPGTPDQNVFYVASTAGTYTNFGGLTVADGEVAILRYNGSWTKDVTGAATKEEVTQLEHKVNGNLMSQRAKNALLSVFEKVAFAVPDVSSEMTELENALFNLDEVTGVNAVYTQGNVVIWSDGVSSLNDLKANLVVKAEYGDGTEMEVHNYTLSGSLTTGTSVITVTYQGFTTTFNVTVTEYGSKMSYTMAEGSILNKPGRLSAYTYGGNENTQGVGNYELSTETTRRVFVTNFGKQKARDAATDNVIDCYPIKIPKSAVSVTVTVSGSNQQIACRVWYLLNNGHFTDRNFNGSEIYPYKSVNYATGTNSLDLSSITGRDDTFLFVWGQRVSGASYSGNEPTAITVTFSNS